MGCKIKNLKLIQLCILIKINALIDKTQESQLYFVSQKYTISTQQYLILK